MNLKFGDIISVYFDSDTCWGTEGYHTAIVLYDSKIENLRLYYLDEDMLNIRKIGLFNPESDEIENFLEYWSENTMIIGNIAMIN